ncbi:14673_t:CDS:2, partial [Entrophospora sp. SA101]
MRKTKKQERICHLCHNTQSTKWRRVTEDALIKCKDNGIRLEVGNPNPSTNSSANAIGKEIYYNAKEVLQNSNMTSFNLKKITLEIDNIDYEIDFMNSNITDGNLILRQDAVVRSCDEAMISRDAYRSLSKNYPELESDGAYHSIIHILNIIIPLLKSSKTFNLFNYTLKIKLSGDGHLVGKVQSQVILTFCLLNE